MPAVKGRSFSDAVKRNAEAKAETSGRKHSGTGHELKKKMSEESAWGLGKEQPWRFHNNKS